MASIVDIRSRSESPLMAGLIKAVEERSPMVNYLAFDQIDSLNYQMKEQGQYPGANFRKFNNTFSTADTAPLDLITVQLADFGLSTSTDYVLARERNREGQDYLAQVRMEVADSIGLDLKSVVIGKNRAAGEPLGLSQWADFYNSSTNPLVFDMGTNGAKISGALSTFIEKLSQMISVVRPNVLIGSREMISTLQSQALVSAQNNALASMFAFETIQVDGRPEIISRFLGIPLIDAGETSAGVAILNTYDEVQGSSSDCSSLYAVRAGVNDFCILHRYAGLIDYNEYSSGQEIQIDVHAPMAPVAKNTRCVGRLKGIKAE